MLVLPDNSYNDIGPVVIVGKQGARERAARKRGAAPVPGAGAPEEAPPPARTPPPAPAPAPAPEPPAPAEFSASAAAEALDGFLKDIGVLPVPEGEEELDE